MEEILKPRELNLVRYYFGMGQPNGKLAIQLNYNGLSGAENAHNGALGKLKKGLHAGTYGQGFPFRKTSAKQNREAEADDGSYITPQGTWLDEKGAGRKIQL